MTDNLQTLQPSLDAFAGRTAITDTPVVSIPAIIAGRVDPGVTTDTVADIPGLRIMSRYPTAHDVDVIEAENRAVVAELATLTLRDVSLFLARAGSAWMDQIGEIGREYGPMLEAATGLNWRVIRSDYEGIGGWMASRADHYQLLRSDLGSVHAMDEWHRSESTRQRAVGRGVVFHGLVGNIPMAGLFSLVRGLLTRNANILKLPSRDPLSVHLFARCIAEAAPEHPLARGISVLYWPRLDDIGIRLMGRADAACLWGSGEAISDMRAAVRPSAPCIALGPRRSCAIIDLTADGLDLDDVARRLAIEVSTYDQEACLSPLRAYVLGPVETFEEPLGHALDDVTVKLPRRQGGIDAEGYIRLVTEEAHVRGWSVRSGDGWVTIVASPKEAAMTHPLGRTVFLHPCTSIDDAAQWLDEDIQTVGVFPYQLAEEVAEKVRLMGGSRVVELGLSRHPRRGFSHDGLKVLQSFVRWISIEDDMESASIYGVLSRDFLYRFFMDL